MGCSKVSYRNATYGQLTRYVPKALGWIRFNAVRTDCCADTFNPYEARTVQIDPGDWLVLYTDGFTEAFNPREEEYGLKRPTRFLKDRRSSPPSEFIATLIADVLKFCDTARPTDDMTVMLITRKR